MSQNASISAVYAGSGSVAPLRIGLEQEPVADGSLTTTDLLAMLALVRSGVSAKTYRAPSCPASVVDGQIVCPLDVWAWPVPLNMDYAVGANQGEFSLRTAVSQEREFDLVINFERTVDLPFETSSLTWEWSDLPCLDRHSNVVDRPVVTATPSSISVDADIVGVLRIRCAAVGWLHTLVLRFDKGDSKISNIKVAMAAWWTEEKKMQTLSLDLTLPGCVAALLETCEDGALKYERGSGKVIRQEQTVPVVYYSECDGQKLALRYERP